MGEDAKIVVLSVTEGEDKPLKYPGIFRKAELMILNKIDLLPYVPFRLELARENARRDSSGDRNHRDILHHWRGIGQWMRWLEAPGSKESRGNLAGGDGLSQLMPTRRLECSVRNPM